MYLKVANLNFNLQSKISSKDKQTQNFSKVKHPQFNGQFESLETHHKICEFTTAFLPAPMTVSWNNIILHGKYFLQFTSSQLGGSSEERLLSLLTRAI